ncbi:MAG: tripartite tricarboxylate transporter substrate binding protein [Proteobacteria bacterium]|nr:tripartite tricarboxylate transporter substrate binding protein [Burkholderiales bacterium]
MTTRSGRHEFRARCRVSTRLALIVGCASTWACATQTFAQGEFPTRPIRFIVPFTPGGASDIQARLIGQSLSPTYGQNILIDNRPGAGTVLATEIAMRTPPDGHTWLFVTTAFVISPSLRQVNYDPTKDFAPLIWLSSSPNMLIANAAFPANSIQELIRLARSKPDHITYASAGAGTAAHVSIELLQTMTGIKLTHVPYKGIAQAMVDLMAGQINLLVTSPVAALPIVKQGKAKALSVGGAKRSPAAPDVPTIGEQGVPGYEASAFQGIVLVAGTPRPLVARIHRDIDGTARAPGVRDRLAEDGSEYVGGSPEAFARHIDTERAKWAKVVRASGAKAD